MVTHKDKIKKISNLRSLIREIILKEGGPAMASATDPTNPQGFYSYELSRGVTDNFWYRSPGRGIGSNGDPGRPSDASLYIGLSVSKDDESNIDATELEPEIDSKIKL